MAVMGVKKIITDSWKLPLDKFQLVGISRHNKIIKSLTIGEEKGKVFQCEHNGSREYVINVITKINFRINKFSQALNTVSTNYNGSIIYARKPKLNFSLRHKLQQCVKLNERVVKCK